MTNRAKDWQRRLETLRTAIAGTRAALEGLGELAPQEALSFLAQAEGTLHGADALLDRADAAFQREEAPRS